MVSALPVLLMTDLIAPEIEKNVRIERAVKDSFNK